MAEPQRLNPADRVVELRRIPSGELIPHELNWRVHFPEQVSALRGALSEIGFADVALAVERADGVYLIDGHARRNEVADDYPVPTIILDLEDDEADLLLTILDPLASMAGTNPQNLLTLLADVDAQNDDLRVFLDRLSEEATGRDARPVIVPDEFPDVDPDAFNLEHTCPRCGFEFS